VLPEAPVTAALTARPHGSTGVGLRNAGERLRLLFGERAGLELRAGAGRCVIAEAVIPLVAAKIHPAP